MSAWWESLNLLTQIFICIALPSTLVLVIQTVFTFIGIGDNGGDADISDAADSADIGDTYASPELLEDAPDTADMSDVDVVHESIGAELRIFSLRTIIAFFCVFGWVGYILASSGAHLAVTLGIAFVSGFAMMLTMALILRGLFRLQSSGTQSLRNALGVSGTVYLPVPASRTGKGKVNIMLQGQYTECEAVTDSAEKLPYNCEVTVIGISGQNTLIVKRK